MSEVMLEYPSDGVAVVRLHAPERKNALVGDMARELVDALRTVDDDSAVGAVVVSGGSDEFCAGAHQDLLSAVAAGDPQAERDIGAVYEVFSTVRALEAPTLAAVCGAAVGAGLNLALACGVRIVGANAYLRSMFLPNAIHPAGGHLRMLRDIGGRSLAVRMAVFDEPLDARAAVGVGLATAVYEPVEVERKTVHLAERAAGAPPLARWINRSIGEIEGLDDQAAAAHEAAAQQATLRQRGAARRRAQ